MSPSRHPLARACILAGLIVGGASRALLCADGTTEPTAPPKRDLTELSLDELAALEITTVARSPARPS